MNGTFMSGAPPAAQVSGQHGTGKSAAATGGLPATQAGRPGKDGPVQTFHLLLAEQMPEKAGRTHDAKTAPKKKPLSAGDRENKEGNPGAPLLIPAAPGGERALAHPSAVRLSGGGVVDVGEIRATGEPAPEGTGFGSGDTAGRRVFSPRRPGAGSVPTEGKWRSEATADLAPRDVEISFPGTDADARGRQVPAHVLGESGDQPGGSGSAGHAGRRPEFADAAGPAPESQAGGNSVQNTPVSAVDARVIRRDPPAVTALTALGGQVFEQEGTSPGIQGVPPADRRRNDPRGMTAGPGVSGTWFQTSPPGQAMQEPPAVLTNVPNEQVGNAVVANLAQRTWRPGESVTLRVTVVPADLGPVQVVAHMDSSGQLHVQIHTASLETPVADSAAIGAVDGSSSAKPHPGPPP
ncbi:MAG: hypothetical protein QJR01_05820 [Kyrpidia sp.]|nr:hypothetical protein [Kyrpidia sp.]